MLCYEKCKNIAQTQYLCGFAQDNPNLGPPQKCALQKSLIFIRTIIIKEISVGFLYKINKILIKKRLKSEKNWDIIQFYLKGCKKLRFDIEYFQTTFY